jgi:hypothetical protein
LLALKDALHTQGCARVYLGDSTRCPRLSLQLLFPEGVLVELDLVAALAPGAVLQRLELLGTHGGSEGGASCPPSRVVYDGLWHARVLEAELHRAPTRRTAARDALEFLTLLLTVAGVYGRAVCALKRYHLTALLLAHWREETDHGAADDAAATTAEALVTGMLAHLARLSPHQLGLLCGPSLAAEQVAPVLAAAQVQRGAEGGRPCRVPV